MFINKQITSVFGEGYNFGRNQLENVVSKCITWIVTYQRAVIQKVHHLTKENTIWGTYKRTWSLQKKQNSSFNHLSSCTRPPPPLCARMCAGMHTHTHTYTQELFLVSMCEGTGH